MSRNVLLFQGKEARSVVLRFPYPSLGEADPYGHTILFCEAKLVLFASFLEKEECY
jgi:hypothetical protein